MQAGDDFATVLGAAIRSRGLSLERIRHRLAEDGVKVSVATLSYWQNGRSQPSRAHSTAVLEALEQVLEVEPGALVQAAPVTSTRRRSSSGPASLELPDSIDRALAEAGLSRFALRTMSTHVTATIGADRTQTSEQVRKVVQCLEDGTDRFPIVVAVDDEATPLTVQQVHGIANCTTGASWTVPELALAMVEMRLPRALRRGECVMFEYLTALEPTPEPCGSLAVAAPRSSELVLGVQFAPGELPHRVVGGMQPDASVDFDSRAGDPLPLSADFAQLVRIDVQPGLYFIAWQW